MFFSYISPFHTINFKLLLANSSIRSKKLKVKQSYLLLTWFFYLSKNKNINKDVSFFVFPKQQNIFTLVRAPMAHKNWSKEQYKFKYFLIKISYRNKINWNMFNKLNCFIFLILTNKLSFNTFETNLFFLKNYSITMVMRDKKFFTYNL